MLSVRTLVKEDWPRVLQIYEEGLDTGMATFETHLPSWEKWDAKYLKPCRLVAIEEGRVVAWAALTPFSKREVYRGVGEVSIYVASSSRGKKVGSKLLSNLIKEARKYQFWTLQAAIFPQNKASIYLHQKAGFRKVGVRERIAQREGIWYDNVLMELRF